jgi:TP901 family phage tail tape measure protein
MAEDPVGVTILWSDEHFRQGVLFYLNSMERMQKETLKTSQLVTSEMAKAGQSTKKAGDQAASSSQKWNKGMQDMMRTARQLVPVLGLLGAARAIQNFVSSSIQEFADFEKGMLEVFTLIPQLSESAMVAMENDILRLGVAQGRLTDETVPALYQAISAGVPPDNVITFMETASIAARGGVSDLKTSVDILTTVINAYGQEAITAERAADILFAAVQGGKVTFTELAKTAFNVVPVAAAVGVSFEDVGAAIAAMTKQGVPARTATTQLRQLLINLAQDGRKAANVFEAAAGVTFPEFIAQGHSLQEAMVIIDSAAKAMGVTTADLFGNIRAGQGSLVLTGEGLKLLAIETDRQTEAFGSMQEASDTMEQSLQFNIDRAAAATEQYKILIGEGLDPLARKWADLKIGAGAWIAEMELGKKAVEEQNLAWDEIPHTLDDVMDRMDRVIATFNEMGTGEQEVAKIAGATKDAQDEVRAMAIEIIRMSKSTSEAKGRINQMTDATLTWNKITKHFVLNMGELGNVVIGSNEEFGALLGTTEELTQADVDAALAANALAVEIEADQVAADALAETMIKLEQTVAGYFSKMLEADDIQGEFNGLLFELAEAGGFSIDEMIELAGSVEEYTDEQIAAAKVMAEVKQESERLILSMEKEGIGHYEIVQALRDEFGEKIANAQATLDLAAASDELTEAQEAAAKAIEEHYAAMREFHGETGALFSQMIDTKDEVGLFTSSIEGLGTQWVRVGGRTAEQNRVLGELTSQYDRADLANRNYASGVTDILMSEDDRNAKIAESTELMGALSDEIGNLQSITGSLVQIYVPAILNQETMNEELFKQAEAAGANAFALAALGVALGEFTEEEAEAALKAAAMQSKIIELGEAIAGGMSIDQAINQMNQFRDNIDQEWKAQLTFEVGEVGPELDKLDDRVEDSAVHAEEMGDYIATSYDDVNTAIASKVGLIGSTLDEFDTNMVASGDAATEAALGAAEDIGLSWGDLEDGLSASAMEYATQMQEIEDVQAAVATGTTSSILAWEAEMKTAIEQLADTTVTAYETEMMRTTDATDTALGDAITEGESRIPEFVTLGSDIAGGIIDGINSRADEVANALGNAVGDAVARGEEKAEAASPSKRMMRLGRDIMFGLWMGMARHRREAIVTAEDFIGEIMGEFEELGPEIKRIASDFQIYSLTDITEEFFTALHDQLGISESDLEAYADTLNNTLIPAMEAWWTEMDRVTSLTDALSSAGGTFADMFTEQTLDPLQDLMDGIDEQSSEIISDLQELFDLSDEEILAQLPELLEYAREQGYDDIVDQLMLLRTLQDERNEAEEQFVREQERILELQKQQQQLSFLQSQLDLIRSLEEAGLDPSEILGGITLGLDASLPDLIAAMTAAMNTMLGVVDEELQIASPSRVFVEYGKQIMAGLGKGITGGSEGVKIIVEDVFRQTIPASVPPISISSPIVNVPVPAASSSINNNYYFGDNNIYDQMDAALFEEQIRAIVTDEV